MSNEQSETDEAFFERVGEECRENGHQWIERKIAPTESLSPSLAARIQVMIPAPHETEQSIYGRICRHCGEYGLECVSCNKTPEELEDHFLSLQSYGQCYQCRNGADDGFEDDYE